MVTCWPGLTVTLYFDCVHENTRDLGGDISAEDLEFLQPKQPFD